jgi:MFS family permease
MIAAHYGVDSKGMGLLVSAQHVSAAIAPMCAGVIADRIGKKSLLVAFTLVFGAGCVLAGCSTGLWIYLAGTFLIGSGYSVCETLVSSVLKDYAPERGMQYINLSQCLLCVGAVISPILLKCCEKSFNTDWRLGFLICAAAFILLSILLMTTKFPQKLQGEKKEKYNVGSFFASGLFVCLFLSIILYVGMENGYGYFIDSLIRSLNPKNSLNALVLSGYWGGMAASRLICGTIKYSPGRMLRVCLSMCAVLFVALVLNPIEWLSVVLSVLIGASYGPVWTTLVGCAADAYPDRSGSAIGLMCTGCALGGIIYPVLMGALAASLNFQWAFVALAVTALVASVLCRAVKDK